MDIDVYPLLGDGWMMAANQQVCGYGNEHGSSLLVIARRCSEVYRTIELAIIVKHPQLQP